MLAVIRVQTTRDLQKTACEVGAYMTPNAISMMTGMVYHANAAANSAAAL
jgi:hypothetical protein